MFAEQAGENVGAFSKENLKRFADDLGLEEDPFNQCLDTHKYLDVVRDDFVGGEERGVRGTPTLFVNGRLVENGGSYQVLRAAVEEALQE